MGTIASNPTIDSFVRNLTIERHRLENGLQVVLQPDTELTLVAVNLWYHVGSRNERPGATGLAHLFEHMLFQGSAHVAANDHFRLVQQAGGTANGSTWFDRTNYYETLPAHQLDLALWLESDRMGHLLAALDQEKLSNQQEVVMNERRQRIDNQPYGRAFERLHELLYPDLHPYRWPVIGYMEDIAAATLDGMAEFFTTYYVPSNAVLTISGDFEPAHALARVEHFFGAIDAGVAPPEFPAPELIKPERVAEVLSDDVELDRLYLATVVPAFGTRDWYTADLLTTALAAGKSSPLYEDIVYTRQIATDINAFVLPTELASSFLITATAKPGVSTAEIEQAVTAHLMRVAREGLTATDLERAHNKVVTALSDQFQRLDDRADLLSMFTTFFDDPERIRSEAEVYRQISNTDFADLAQRFFATGLLVSLTVAPRGAA